MVTVGFRTVTDLVSISSPLQKKALTAWLPQLPPELLELAEGYTTHLIEDEGWSPERLAASYVELCQEMVAEQLKFKRTGRYSATCAREVDMTLYSQPEVMRGRTYALGLSQFLWPNHCRLFAFFRRALLTDALPAGDHLELGPGHGLHLLAAARARPGARLVAVDISASSLTSSQRLLARFGAASLVEFIQADVAELQLTAGRGFDSIVVNEVLEHLDHPEDLLRRVRPLLTARGRLFVTTCANAPAKDHVFLYRSVEEIRAQLERAGYGVVAEEAVPVGTAPRSDWTTQRVEVNYSALLEPRGETEGPP